MSNPTTNFGWQMPTPTDLVTDLPADFAVFGQAVDTDFQDLLGGTTGQVLSKTSNTDLDFTWVASASGDVTGVTAGTGITVSDPTGPVPTVTNAMATTITTNGDLIYGTGSGTFTRRAIGSTGNVLTVAGGIPTWAAPAGGGKVLQVVFATTTTFASSSITSYADTNLTATITPTLNTSKILVLVDQNGCGKAAANTSELLRLVRGATTLIEICDSIAYTGGSVGLRGQSISASYLDSPATTSATTYKTQFRSENTDTVYVQVNNIGTTTSTITLLEIGA